MKQIGKRNLLCPLLATFALMAFMACSDDEKTLMETRAMTEETVGTGDCIINLNGDKLTDECTATFTSISGSDTKMRMSISGLNPEANIDVDVDVVPEEGAISFSGSVDNTNYKFEIAGTFMELWRDKGTVLKPRVRATATYTSKDQLTNNTAGYTIRFDNSCVTPMVSGNGMEEVADMMSRNYAETLSAMKLVFGTDGKLSVYTMPKDSTTFALDQTVRFWEGQSQGSVTLDLTEKQANEFCNFWIGDLSALDTYTPLFTESATKSGSYPLTLAYTGSTATQFYLADDATSYLAFELYSKCKGAAFATATEKEHMQTLLELYKTDKQFKMGVKAQ